MLVTFLAAGTRGDVQPYLALGVALRKAGFQVRIATFENFKNMVLALGLDFYSIQGDVAQVTASEIGQEAMQADNPLKLILSFNKLKSLAAGLHQNFYEACLGADAVVYHPGATIGYFAAKQLNIPAILATPFPMTPTTTYPSIIFYDKVPHGKKINLLTHKMTEQIMWTVSSGPIKHYWKQKFGHTPENFGNPFPKQITRTFPTIISCSHYVFPRPSEWSAHVHQTGYWFLDEDDWTPPVDLLAFLQNGPPPVYVGFGSIGDSTKSVETTKLAIEALKLSGQRGILATGWHGMSKMETVPENIFFLESAPHAWLFPRMAAVVHHGGAGTTAAGLRAGVPSIITPFGNDQFAWARRVYELSVGARPIPRKKLTTENLSEAIRFALAEDIKTAAKQLGGKIQSENGAETAAQVIVNSLHADE